MAETLDINGNQYSNENYKNYYGYKCCTTVNHDINMTSNSSDIGNTIDIPQLDCNSHMLVMHLYDNNILLDLTHATQYNLVFKCGNDKTVIGDWRRLQCYNPYRGTVTYLLSKEETNVIGLNTLQLTLTIDNGELTFYSCYNVVPSIQTNNNTVVYPDTPNNDEYNYGPHCHCETNLCTNEPTSLQELNYKINAHINDDCHHTTLPKNITIDSAFITVDNYDKLIEMAKMCPEMQNQRLFRVNNVNDEVKYYYWDATSYKFVETTLGTKGNTGKDAGQLKWSDTGYETITTETVGGLETETDISNLTIAEIIGKMVGITTKIVPTPIITNTDDIELTTNITSTTLTFPITNCITAPDIDLTKVIVNCDKELTSNVLFDDVNNSIIITITNILAVSNILVTFDEGVVSQVGDGIIYTANTKLSEQTTCSIINF